jgi:phage terminase large subunit GpA-like protein
VKKKRIVKLEPQTVELFAEVLSKLRPPPPLTVSQWADKYRVLSAESSAEPGRWHTEKAPYQRAIMDAIGDPHVRSVVVMSAAQIGKTDAFILNPLGYYMDYAPCPVMCMQPTLDMGQTLSKDRIAPMIRDTPRLTGLVDTKSRYAGNTVMVSTPTIKGDSRIEDAYLLSTQEEWNVPCPECGAYQPFLWENVKFDPDDLDKGVSYVCRECGCIANEYRWKEQGIHGKYVAANPGAEARGFHLNTLASTFVGWKEVVQKFIEAKIALDHGNPEQMKVWVNTELGETWEERGIQLEDTELFNRREIYAAEVPDDVLYLTAGVDVQDDRFEVEVVGWGEGVESWGIRYQKIYGDMLSDQVWDDLDNFLLQTWRKADGTAYPLLATCIDSGGHHTDAVYRFAKERLNRRIFAIKGMGGSGVPFIRNPSKNNRVKAELFILGVDAGKTTIYQRLEVKTPGPNYCHFPSNPEAGYTEEYFKGLTAEKKVVRFVKGRLKEYWEIKDKEHKRNEPLDLRNYATAALAISRPVLKKTDADGTAVQPVKKARGRRQLSGGI